jgi:hypothetical protein
MPNLLQYEVVHFDHICVLFRRHQLAVRMDSPQNMHLLSELIGGTVDANDEVSTLLVHSMTTCFGL